MKKSVITCLLIAVAFAAHGQPQLLERITFTTTIGTAIPLSKPASTPFTWQAMAHYDITPRFSGGVGTGLSFYEKTLIPLYGDLRYRIGRERRFTPFIHAGAGYSFAPSANANGGLFLNPAIGITCRLQNRLKIQLSVGYELQKLERLKTHTDDYFAKEFAEKLSHSAISVKLGVRF